MRPRSSQRKSACAISERLASSRRLAGKLGTQDSVSRLEKRSDPLLSTLRKTVKAMGGEVRIVAEFPDRAPVVLSDAPMTVLGADRVADGSHA